MADIKLNGEVLEALPSVRFKVELQDGRVIIAYLGGRLHKNFIRILIGDKVQVTMPDTGNIGRIIKRL